jgi:hypothetical protein
MHGLLAVSALHYAQHHPGQRKEYILVSSHYQNLALNMFAVKLQDINEEKNRALYLPGHLYLYLEPLFHP